MSKFRVIAALALIAIPQARAQEKLEVSGVILPRDGGGMYLRNAKGDRIEIGWSEKTQVALKVDTRQLGDLKIAVDPVKEARKSLSSLERDVMDKPEEIFAQAGAAIANFLGAATYNYELSLKQGELSNALLFNLLTTADCKPLVNRATVIGKKKNGDVIVADEIHLQPIGE